MQISIKKALSLGLMAGLVLVAGVLVAVSPTMASAASGKTPTANTGGGGNGGTGGGGANGGGGGKANQTVWPLDTLPLPHAPNQAVQFAGVNKPNAATVLAPVQRNLAAAIADVNAFYAQERTATGGATVCTSVASATQANTFVLNCSGTGGSGSAIWVIGQDQSTRVITLQFTLVDHPA